MKNYPVIRIILYFISGIILEQYITVGLLFFAVIYFLTLVFYIIPPKYQFQAKKLIISLLINCSFILAGNYSSMICFSGQQFYSENIEKEDSYTLYGTVESIYLINKSGLRFEINADSVLVNTFRLHRKVILLCNVKDKNKKKLDSLYSSIFPGNKICASGTFIKGRTCRNPGEFDYNKYLHLYGTTGILNVYNSDDFKILDYSKNWVSAILFQVRKSIAEKLSRYHDYVAASLMKGLLLADRSEMNDETKTEFVNAGVVHVLAVSGLNVIRIATMYHSFGKPDGTGRASASSLSSAPRSYPRRTSGRGLALNTGQELRHRHRRPSNPRTHSHHAASCRTSSAQSSPTKSTRVPPASSARSGRQPAGDGTRPNGPVLRPNAGTTTSDRKSTRL